MTANAGDLGHYTDALKADKDAKSVIRWSGPIIVLGWIMLAFAIALIPLGLFGAVAIGGADASGVSVAFSTIVIAAVFGVQAALVLVLGYYVRMRANWTRFRVGAALSDD